MTGRERRKKQRRVDIERRRSRIVTREKIFDNGITISEHTLKKSFLRAIRGINLVIDTQKNFIMEGFLFLLILILSLLMRLNLDELIHIILISGLVLVAEVINTSIEYVIDSFHNNDFNVNAKKAKDISSGAVLLSCIFAIIVASLIFIPKF